MQVFWLNREETLKSLEKAVIELVDQHPEIERVVLFGSLARGDAVPGSDADLLLILQGSGELPFLTRSARYMPAGVGVGVDVFAYTREELDAMLEAGNSFVAQALREGVVLFGCNCPAPLLPAVETAPTVAKSAPSASSGQASPTRSLTDEGRFRKGCREFIRQARSGRVVAFGE